MKRIVPFNNILTFDTDVSEITAISLEHDITKEIDTLSGVFYITGEYKKTNGAIDSDKFNFELPFDIALGNEYNLDTLEVDIDDFRYELVDRDKLKVNIDLYIDGEIISPVEINREVVSLDDGLFTEKEMRKLSEDEEKTPSNEDDKEKEEESQEESDMSEEEANDEIDVFGGFNEEERYVTYHVYPVMENDTLDKIMEKYNVTKEELAKYNNIDDIHTGDKLIIPANDK